MRAAANEACQTADPSFMDANLPIYSVLSVGQAPDAKLKLADTSKSAGPQISLVRLGAVGANASCADARAAAYP
jgi:hypothetical protein